MPRIFRGVAEENDGGKSLESVTCSDHNCASQRFAAPAAEGGLLCAGITGTRTGVLRRRNKLIRNPREKITNGLKKHVKSNNNNNGEVFVVM